MDSESDNYGTRSGLRERTLELLCACAGQAFTVKQLSSILGVDERTLIKEVQNCDAVMYDAKESVMRAAMMEPLRGSETVPRIAVTTPDDNSRYGQAPLVLLPTEDTHLFSESAAEKTFTLESSFPLPVRGGGYKSDSYGGPLWRRTTRKSRHRGTALEPSKKTTPAEEEGPVGRVGYVCVAEEFRLGDLESYYRSKGYFTKFDFDVLHIRLSEKSEMAVSSLGGRYGATANRSIPVEKGDKKKVALSADTLGFPTGSGCLTGFDLFIFGYGAVVWWGFDQRFFKLVENDFMLPNSAIAHCMINRYTTNLVNENYPVWCTYTLVRSSTLETVDDFKERLRFDHFLISYGRGEVETCGVSMLCASHALAQSAKIDYLEIKVQELAQSCSPLPRELREQGRVTITERRLLQLRGEVLSCRLMLKSGSDLLDEPDFFWENAHLKPIFQATKECFEISGRVEALDNKLDAANEILSMLAEEFSQRHGARLEWIVIWLVFVEVIIGVMELLMDVRPWLSWIGK